MHPRQPSNIIGLVSILEDLNKEVLTAKFKGDILFLKEFYHYFKIKFVYLQLY